MDDSRRCTAHLTDGSGERCRKAAICGGTVCATHGGSAPQVKRSARERLLEAADPAAARLVRALESEDDRTAIRAAQIILDRAGLHPRQPADHERRDDSDGAGLQPVRLHRSKSIAEPAMVGRSCRNAEPRAPDVRSRSGYCLQTRGQQLKMGRLPGLGAQTRARQRLRSAYSQRAPEFYLARGYKIGRTEAPARREVGGIQPGPDQRDGSARCASYSARSSASRWPASRAWCWSSSSRIAPAVAATAAGVTASRNACPTALSRRVPPSDPQVWPV